MQKKHVAGLVVGILLAGLCQAQAAVDWVCQYSPERANEHLHLICLTDSRDPVAIPIWAYDYGDGMVEQLMHAALCYRSQEPCTVFLDRKARAA